MAELLGRDVEQHVLAAGVDLADALGKVPHRGRQFAVRTAELLEQQRREGRICFGYAHRILQSLVVNKHEMSRLRKEFLVA